MAEETPQAQPAPQEPTQPTVKSLSGFDEGAVLADGSVIKGDYDDSGVLIGWHKEMPAEGGSE